MCEWVCVCVCVCVCVHVSVCVVWDFCIFMICHCRGPNLGNLPMFSVKFAEVIFSWTKTFWGHYHYFKWDETMGQFFFIPPVSHEKQMQNVSFGELDHLCVCCSCFIGGDVNSLDGCYVSVQTVAGTMVCAFIYLLFVCWFLFLLSFCRQQ